ncbi:CBS domain-containing protein [Alteromonas sp. a30]|uniref:CBS domain-containing protein n=1 Tax=Alteromonas sp. a30 TaxID=2730917 RepID=UPI002282B6F6|nr:CBS domain-containing protein [Alteromonas sp. a30]MCY7296395.1 CBS domain-containing protein [Alteromonas sp. a30]
MESLKVKEYMQTHPVLFHIDMPVAEAVEMLIHHRQSGGAVVDDNKKVIGFLSEQDCLNKMIESSYYREQVAKVGEIMQTNVKSVKPYDSIVETAQRIVSECVLSFPVIDDDGLLLGYINRTHILKAIDLQLHDGYRVHD